MAQAASLLFILGTIVVAIGFAAHVGHAVLLANGRRLAAAFASSASPAPALAAAGVTGSFVTTRASQDADGPALAASPTGLSRAATIVTVLALVLLVGSLVARAIVVGRGPYGNMYEFSVAFGTSILGGYLLLAQRYAIRQIGFIPVGVSLAVLLYASSLPGDVEPLVPALQNAPLLTIHVGMAVLSYGIFATAFAAGVGYLVQGTKDRFSWLPSHRTLDEVAYRSVIIAFPIFATMIVLGSWWASIAWSAYWSWDPKETSALVTWLTYAVYLHARNQRRWAGRPAALLLVVGFAMVLVTYSGSLWFTGLHAYSGL
jgi:cytochrome c-type biogenesis protein CcsB